MIHDAATGSTPELGRGTISPRGFGPPANRDLILSDARSGQRTVRKVFPSDQGDAVQRECAALDLVRGAGVPEVVGRGEDESARPWIELEWVGDEDLRMRVGDAGPLPASEVVEFGRQAAAILERIHAVPMVHGDVKPANFVLAPDGQLFLVDFENAVPGTAAGPEARFTGGTYGFAPPEAYLGHAPSPAFDRFGLGATLHYLLTGSLPPRWRSGEFDATLLLRLRPCLPNRILRVVCDLLATAPDARPEATAVRRELEQCRAPEDDPVDRALLVGTHLEGTAHEELLAQRAHWARKLENVLQKLPATPQDSAPHELVEGAIKFCRAMHLCMNFVPLLPDARARLGRAQRRLPELLERLPGDVQQLRQQLELGSARSLARLSVQLCRIVSVLNLPDRDAPHLIQSTGHTLQSALKRLDLEEGRQRTILTRLEDAEAALDLPGARAILAELLESFSGANARTARVRDKHHRFAWLVERAAQGREGVDEGLALVEGQDAPDVTALVDYLDRMAEALAGELDTGHRSLGLLGRVFAELADGYPKLDLGHAAAQLEELRLALTDRAVTLLEQMAARLEVDPVPLRLLLRDLLQVDRILMLDCLVDCDRMTRTELLDRLERLRLRIEEISDKNRRIAAGAREQLEQGRLTTALYDLERAIQSSAEEEGRGVELKQELEKVRRLREDVRKATRRNLELQELYARLEDESDAGLATRLECLTQREGVLLFLLDKGPKSFHQRYQLELRDLRRRRVHAISEDAEERLRATPEPEARMTIASEVLERIDDANATEDMSGPTALRNRWRDYYERARTDIEERQRRERADRARARWIRTALFIVLAAVAVAVVYLTTT